MATPTVTYDDLIAELVRYGGNDEAYWRAKYPEMTKEMIAETMKVGDECPYCHARFVGMAFVMHSFGCPVAEMGL